MIRLQSITTVEKEKYYTFEFSFKNRILLHTVSHRELEKYWKAKRKELKRPLTEKEIKETLIEYFKNLREELKPFTQKVDPSKWYKDIEVV